MLVAIEVVSSGKLTADQVRSGYAALKVIEDCINRNDLGNKLLEACDQFYTRIPHNFGMRRPPIINTKQQVKEKLALLETLSDIEIALKVLSGGDQKDHPIDRHYQGLNCPLTPLDAEDDEFRMVVKYVRQTHAKTHNQYRLEVQEVFKVARQVELDYFKDVGNSHGTTHTQICLVHDLPVTEGVMTVPIEKLEDQLNCPICLDVYTSPKQLQCHHVFCQQCLDRHVAQSRPREVSLTCPDCRRVTPVPATGVAGLQAAFHVNQLLQIVEEHKVIVASGEIQGLSTDNIPNTITIVCTEHDRNEVALFCETCGETICWECIMKGSKHHSHEYKKLYEAIKLYKEDIALSLDSVMKNLAASTKALKVLHQRQGEISDQRASVKADIHSIITRLHGVLESRRTELISQLDQLTQAKLDSLAAQKEELEEIQVELNSCLLFMRENLNQGEVLTITNTTARQVKEWTTVFKSDVLKPQTEADMTFSTQRNLGIIIKDYGQVYAAGASSASKCCVVGNKVDSAKVGELSTIILQTMNLDYQPCSVPASSISCELVSEIAGVSVRGSVERRRQSQSNISYQPTIKGTHQLHIKVEGQHVYGSPFPVRVLSPVEVLGAPILSIGGVMKPDGVVVNHCGEVVVTEEGGHCVTVFSPNGEKLRSFGVLGNGQGQFYNPLGVAVDGEKNILVADCYNHRIQKFTAQGKFLKEVGKKGSGPLQFSYPVGIAVSATNGRVYVAENGNHRIQVLNSNLSYFDTFGERGSAKGNFNLPWYVACDSTGNVYVADLKNHCIQVFSAEGEFLRMFGKNGGDKMELNEPCGIAIDSSDRVYVSDSGSNCVLVFTPDGRVVTSFGSKGEGPGHFKWPHGLTVDSSGVVYVCDHANDRVQLF